MTTIQPEGSTTETPAEQAPARASELAQAAVASKPWASKRSGRSHTPWTVRADLDLVRLRAALTASDAIPTTERSAAAQLHRASAESALDEAQDVLDGYRGQGPISRRLTSGACYTAVLARLQAAAEELVYCQSKETLLSRLPGLAAAVRTYIGPTDTRREVYLTYLQNLRDHYAPTNSATVGTGDAVQTVERDTGVDMSDQRTQPGA